MLFTVSSFSQYQHGINYQTVVRDSSGNILKNHLVSFRINILQGSSGGASVYSEIQLPTTNKFGLVTFTIGMGSNQTGNFNTINWGIADFYLKTEIDVTGGGYINMGTTQILSVPRATYSDVVGKIGVNQVNDENITDITRRTYIPATALSFDKTNSAISFSPNGVRFKYSGSASANGIIPVPADWDSTTDMTLELYFTPVSTGSGNIDFVVKVSGHNPGDSISDPGPTNGTAVAFSSTNKLFKETFTIPFYVLESKEIIYIYSIQRQGPSETYTGDVDLKLVSFRYHGRR